MTQKKTYRIDQINRLLREEIAAILLTELQNEALLSMTVTGVKTSRDLHYAIVYITANKNKSIPSLLETANRCAGTIRKLLFPCLRLKHIPEIEFRYDDTLDTAERIFRTLEQIHEESDQPPSED